MEVSVRTNISNHSSTKSDLEKDLSELDINNDIDKSLSVEIISSSKDNSNEKLNTLKKRVSSAKTPNRTTTKARRVRFFRNGDKFWTGYLVAVSQERYK
jgi:doublecortin-like kinase 1/2